ncbi:hypothetical protein JOC36_001274 [Weissella uvarum]|uniref:hypothetical protein n=1 Tax=Weissella uvarum TaxID=1479233 RepID=UPI0019601629|nr:hypothetical protein [Weissella uvarum]MBM7617712.1 hypothetical protein [Weissella uvarum]MCM0596061.1 hypothetical protein [Weissella uvarum]
MDEDYKDRLSRLDRLDEQPATSTSSTQTTRLNQPHSIYQDKIYWALMLISIIAQLAIWWIYPLIYSRHLDAQSWQPSPVLIIYSVLLALATYLTFTHGLKQRINYLFILLPICFIYFLYQQMTIQQVILLVLLPLSLFLMNVPWLNLNNILGLILYSSLATLSMPVVIFYQENTFLTQPFLISLLPLFMNYMYYMSSIFVTDGQEKRVTGLILGIVLLLNVLSLSWNFWTFLAIVIIIFTWMVLINFDVKYKYRMGLLSFFEMITVLVIFLQQR